MATEGRVGGAGEVEREDLHWLLWPREEEDEDENLPGVVRLLGDGDL